MKNLMPLTLTLLLLSACNFSKSVQVDLISGLTTKGDVIKCESVSISVNGQTVNRTTFMYGEIFSLDFSGVEGLKSENGHVFPGMALVVRNSSGDTVLADSDLYSEYGSGINLSPLELSAKITAAKPVHSGGDYKLFIRIWDKKDKGTFIANLGFKLVTNEKISVKTENGVTCDEVYLFSKNSGNVINNNVSKVNDETFLLFEGIKGFKETDGKVYPGLAMKASADDGESLFNYEDMFLDYTASGIDMADFNRQVMTRFSFNTADIKAPIHVSVSIWDKKGGARISAVTDLTLEK
jgi:hypothetical protein